MLEQHEIDELLADPEAVEAFSPEPAAFDFDAAMEEYLEQLEQCEFEPEPPEPIDGEPVTYADNPFDYFYARHGEAE